MENRIEKLFKQKDGNILSVFITAGYPYKDDTLKLVSALDESGTDMIEIGIPFSDPLADGPTIQQSSTKALKNGMNLKYLFSQLKELRDITQKPVLLMGYLNSVMQYGIKEFYYSCSLCGIDGVILPDLPVEEYNQKHRMYMEEYGIFPVFLLSPKTSLQRAQKIDALSKGFIYLLSTNATTGNQAKNLIELKKTISDFNLTNPVMVGFGINNAETYLAACEVAKGAIIGSEYIRRITDSKNYLQTTKDFINEIKHLKNDYTVI